MASRRFKLVEVPCQGHPRPDELTIDFGLLDGQLQWLEGLEFARPKTADTEEDGQEVEGIIGLIDGLKDTARALGVPDAELYPRSSNHD